MLKCFLAGINRLILVKVHGCTCTKMMTISIHRMVIRHLMLMVLLMVVRMVHHSAIIKIVTCMSMMLVMALMCTMVMLMVRRLCCLMYPLLLSLLYKTSSLSYATIATKWV